MSYKILSFLTLIAFGLLACGDDQVAGAQKSASDQKGSSAMNVQAVRVQPKSLNQNLNATGTFAANESVELTPEYAGTIQRISFCEGCSVNRGELLLILDHRDIDARVERLDVDISLAQKELDRAKNLRNIEAISEEELQERANRLESLQAEQKVLEVQRSKMSIRAPFSGMIGLRKVSPGSYIRPGTVITSLKQIDPIKLEFDIPAEYAHTLSVGDTIQFSNSQVREEHSAVIYASESAIDQNTRSRTFIARADNSDHAFLPGAYADIYYTPFEDKKALMVPAEAIMQEVRGQVVYKVVNGKAQKQTVAIGTRTQNAVELTSGISAGDTVMITGLLNVSNDMPVDVSIEDILENE